MSVPGSKAPDDERLAGYLLGRLTEEEQESVEQFYFGGEENLDLLAAAEDDLIDSYVRGELDARERASRPSAASNVLRSAPRRCRARRVS